MRYILNADGIQKEIDIVVATHADIEALLLLNKKWQRNQLGVNTMKGFLSGSFDSAAFEDLINQNAVIAAKNEDGLQAYMLSVNNINEGILQEHKEVAEQLKEKGIMDKAARVAVGIQTAVEEEYHGTGLISMVRAEFKKLLRGRYDYLFTTISKDNHRSFKSATNYGWQVVGENEEHYYLILPV